MAAKNGDLDDHTLNRILLNKYRDDFDYDVLSSRAGNSLTVKEFKELMKCDANALNGLISLVESHLDSACDMIQKETEELEAKCKVYDVAEGRIGELEDLSTEFKNCNEMAKRRDFSFLPKVRAEEEVELQVENAEPFVPILEKPVYASLMDRGVKQENPHASLSPIMPDRLNHFLPESMQKNETKSPYSHENSMNSLYDNSFKFPVKQPNFDESDFESSVLQSLNGREREGREPPKEAVKSYDVLSTNPSSMVRPKFQSSLGKLYNKD